ncbi:MAG TPA: hypothetical protein PLK85_05840 [Alphaproteobacteria bacterium]|nr:hypothetical protein [Alphaproteobacteria bacterium]
MSHNHTPTEFPLVVAFRTKEGFHTSPIEIRLVGNLSPYPVIGAKNSDIIKLCNLTRAEFNALGGDAAVKAAFSAAVNNIRSHNGFPTAQSSAERIANEAVAKASQEILSTFGTKKNTQPVYANV